MWLATGHTDMRRGMRRPGAAGAGDARSAIRMRAICTCSGAAAANHRHSAYGFRFATIAYRWHPLFGRTLQVSPFRRGKELTCIYTNERPDLCRELPNWMFDESYCAGMTLGPPEISIEGLNELAGVLALLGANRKRGAQSRPSKKKERDGAEKPTPRVERSSSSSWSVEVLKQPWSEARRDWSRPWPIFCWQALGAEDATAWEAWMSTEDHA